MSTYFVRPKEPTILSPKKYYQLSSTNLVLSAAVSYVHEIPEILDIERFNDALSGALSSFPHVAGRLVRPDTPDAPWAIRLTSPGIPVTVIDSDADKIIPTDLSAQSSLHLAQPLKVMKIIITEGESDEPLFGFTITRFKKLNSTSIGSTFSHVLFDGAGFLMFLGAVSQFYQGLGPIDPPPYYEPEAIKLPVPSAPFVAADRYDLSGPFPWEHPDRKALEFVAFRLTASQVAQIYSAVSEGKNHLRISRADVLTVIIARCFLGIETQPIHTILSVVDHRGMGLFPPTAALNAVFWLPTSYQDSEGADIRDSVLTCATELRKSLGKLNDPEFVKDAAAGFAKIQSEVSWDKVGQDLAAAQEGALIMNSLWKMGWTRPHFGHPGKVKFYHKQTPGPRHAKIMSASPAFVDGNWTNRGDDLEVTFYAPAGKKKRAEELFEGYARGLGMTGAIEYLA